MKTPPRKLQHNINAKDVKKKICLFAHLAGDVV
jgi:hypothetical protein